MREIEIKLHANDLASLEEKLKEQGCILSEPLHQYDRIYTYGDDVSVFTKGKSGHNVMRIRVTDNGAEFNMKVQQTHELDNLEHETTVSNPEAVHAILAALGYTPKIEVRKTRRKGRLGEYEICLDTVEGLGSFVELEKLAEDDADPSAVREDLLATLESLGLSRADEETRGYDTQIFQRS